MASTTEAVVTQAEAHRLMTSVGWLSGQPPASQARLLAASEMRTIPAREVIYAIDDPPGGLYGIADGYANVLIASGPFPPRLVHVGGPGWWVGEVALAGMTPLAITLGCLAGLRREHERVVELPISQEELGEIVRLSRNTIGRELGVLAKSGCVEKRYGYIAVNRVCLAARITRAP